MGQSTCSVVDCERPSKIRGWCGKHYARWLAHGDPSVVHPPGRSITNQVCQVADCEKPAKCRQLCPAHYRRLRLGRPMNVPLRRRRPGSTCEVDGCTRKYAANGLCSMHHQRMLRSGEVGPTKPTLAPSGSGYVNPDGYRIIRKNGRNHQEHRLVMEQVLGRPLYDFERVHHLNGRRADNRPENLELWVTPQPYGQRPEDLVAWVLEFYSELVDKLRLG